MESLGRILLGTSGWSYDEWVGSLYTDRKQRKLTYYSRIFPTVEIDSTFYAYPTKGTAYGWTRHTPPSFIFSAKLPQVITHEKMLDLQKGVENDLRRFCDLLEPLSSSGKLGALLIQCPPRFSYDPERLEAFFQILPAGFEYAIEFRHPSWMQDETSTLLSRYNVAYTIVDEPLLPPDTATTADFSYIRWHGHGKKVWFDYRYSAEELTPWTLKVEEVAKKTKKLYGYFNNHFHGYAVENCLQILEMLGVMTPEQKRAKAALNSRSVSEGQKDLRGFF